MITTPLAAPVVEATGLAKQFGSTTAVRDVSLLVQPAEIVGLVGPNGAGKTTTIRMLLDIIQPDAGVVTLFGGNAPHSARNRIGYLPEERGLYRHLRVIPNLLYLAELKGVPRDVGLRRANALLSRLGLAEYSDRRIRELSRGLGQLVQFAVTLIHEPAFVVLDEPFSGLDPLNTRLMKDIVAERRDAGAAIMLSTHQMTDVEELCDRVILVADGRLVLEGALSELKQRFAADEIFVVGDRVAEPIAGVTGSRRRGPGYILTLARDHPPEMALRTLLDRGARIERFEVAAPSLEDIFLRVVQEHRG